MDFPGHDWLRKLDTPQSFQFLLVVPDIVTAPLTCRGMVGEAGKEKIGRSQARLPWIRNFPEPSSEARFVLQRMTSVHW